MIQNQEFSKGKNIKNGYPENCVKNYKLFYDTFERKLFKDNKNWNCKIKESPLLVFLFILMLDKNYYLYLPKKE